MEKINLADLEVTPERMKEIEAASKEQTVLEKVLECRENVDSNYQLLSKRIDELNERLSKHIEDVNTGFLSLQETQASFESHLKALHQALHQ